MKPEYDFSKGERGKFFHPGAEVRFPVYLDADVQRYFAERASAKGVTIEELLNALLRREIETIELLK